MRSAQYYIITNSRTISAVSTPGTRFGLEMIGLSCRQRHRYVRRAAPPPSGWRDRMSPKRPCRWGANETASERAVTSRVATWLILTGERRPTLGIITGSRMQTFSDAVSASREISYSTAFDGSIIFGYEFYQSVIGQLRKKDSSNQSGTP